MTCMHYFASGFFTARGRVRLSFLSFQLCGFYLTYPASAFNCYHHLLLMICMRIFRKLHYKSFSCFKNVRAQEKLSSFMLRGKKKLSWYLRYLVSPRDYVLLDYALFYLSALREQAWRSGESASLHQSGLGAIPDSTSYLDWVCFLAILPQEVFPWVLHFSTLIEDLFGCVFSWFSKLLA